MEEKEQEEKQNYLRQNILEKGYDANEFVSFLQSKKGEAASDISNWSMKDLHAVVQEFISNHENENKKEIEPQKNQQQNQDIAKDYVIIESNSINTNENNKNQKNKINSYNLTINDENFGIIIPEFIECQKAEKNALCDAKNIEITVTEPKKINNGFFSKTYVNFLITTNPINLKVRRKHYDFVWLRERLVTIFNLNVIPRLPKKGKTNGDNHINKRMRNLQLFLNYLLKDNLIKNSQIFYDFLSIENEEEFEKKKKIYNKLKTPVEIKEIKSLDGQVKIEVTPQKEILLDKIRNNAIYNETILKQINDNFKLLKLEMDNIITRMASFFPMLDKLMKIRKTYLPNNIIFESYNQLKNIFISWTEVLKKQKYFFNIDVKEYLKLLGGNYNHLKTLSESVDEQKNYYKKISKNLIAKKIELYERYEIEDWQLSPQDQKKVKTFSKDKSTSYKKICYSSTVEAIKLKEKYGYQLNKIISEYNRLKSIMNIENRQKIMDFTDKQKQILYNHIIKMGEIIGIMDNCFDENSNENIVRNKVEISEIQQDEENNIENNEIKNEEDKQEENNIKENQYEANTNKEEDNQDKKGNNK